MEYKAKPTRYREVLFRSRLEARWAVCFDELGIPWQYEPEKFDLGELRYIPDFHLAGCVYCEVKPAISPQKQLGIIGPLKQELRKWNLFMDTGRPLLLLWGPPRVQWWGLMDHRLGLNYTDLSFMSQMGFPNLATEMDKPLLEPQRFEAAVHAARSAFARELAS